MAWPIGCVEPVTTQVKPYCEGWLELIVVVQLQVLALTSLPSAWYGENGEVDSIGFDMPEISL